MMEAELKGENGRYRLEIDVSSFKAWDNDMLLERIGKMCGEAFHRKLREYACEQTEHRWENDGDNPEIPWERRCTRCMLVEDRIPA